MKKLILMLLLVYPLSALAITYEWTDERGTVHFTEDLGKVPKKLRKKVKVLGGEEKAPGSAENAPGGQEGVPGSQEGGAPRGAGQPVRVTPGGEQADKGERLYGGRDESAWRRDFLEAADELKHTESELSLLRGRLSDTSKMSRSEYLSIQITIKHTENRLQQLQRKLDLLRESADRHGVPAQARQ